MRSTQPEGIVTEKITLSRDHMRALLEGASIFLPTGRNVMGETLWTRIVAHSAAQTRKSTAQTKIFRLATAKRLRSAS